MTQVIEFDYKTFSYVKSRAVTDEKFKEFLLKNKDKIVEYYPNIHKIKHVVDFCIDNCNSFKHTIITLHNNDKEQMIIQNQVPNQPVFALFEMLFNMKGSTTEEITFLMNFYFTQQNDTYIYYKQISTIEGEKINTALNNAYNYHKKNNNFNEDIFSYFQKMSDYIKEGFILCRKSVDIFDNTHFDVVVNPKVAIDSNKKLQIGETLTKVETYFQY